MSPFIFLILNPSSPEWACLEPRGEVGYPHAKIREYLLGHRRPFGSLPHLRIPVPGEPDGCPSLPTDPDGPGRLASLRFLQYGRRRLRLRGRGSTTLIPPLCAPPSFSTRAYFRSRCLRPSHDPRNDLHDAVCIRTGAPCRTHGVRDIQERCKPACRVSFRTGTAGFAAGEQAAGQ